MYKLTYETPEAIGPVYNCSDYYDMRHTINIIWANNFDSNIEINNAFVYELVNNAGDTIVYDNIERARRPISHFAFDIDNNLIQSIKFRAIYRHEDSINILPFDFTLERTDKNKKESKKMECRKTIGCELTKKEKEGKTMEKIPNNLEKSIRYHCAKSSEYGTYIKAEKLCKAILENFECDDTIKEMLENTIEKAHEERAKKDAARRKAREKKRGERWRCTVPIVKRILEEEGMVTFSIYIDYCSKINNYNYAGIQSTYEFARFLVEYAKEYSNVRLSKDNVFTLYSVSYLKEKYNI